MDHELFEEMTGIDIDCRKGLVELSNDQIIELIEQGVLREEAFPSFRRMNTITSLNKN
ncbi:hypothetical protein [Paenibacillus agilis]|uniref:hypothetical protein n=1 Tax=Paenibacillus agilis TaxID=3020863 RepID=UPI001649D451|nr:hypothetical protein [Paenibacillus agilis]